MKIHFYLKGGFQVEWVVPHPDQFNFQLLAKMIRADGCFLAEGVYINANEVAAIWVERRVPAELDDEGDDPKAPNVQVNYPRGKPERKLVS